MKKEIKYTAFANAGILIVILVCAIASGARDKDIGIIMGLGFLCLAIVNIAIGLFLMLLGLGGNKANTRYGTSMLLVAGISLLCSLTFCSMSL